MTASGFRVTLGGSDRPDERTLPVTSQVAMTLDRLIQLQRAQPFRPYRIHLADGKTLDVVHPEFLARSPQGRTASLHGPNDELDIIDLLLVTRLEVIIPAIDLS